jgi:diguanylate cyclase (GGDEF)-like protein
MGTLRERVPNTPLGRARLATLVFAGVITVAPLGQINHSLAGDRWVAGTLALLGLVALYTATYVRERVLWVDPVMIGVLAIVAGSSFQDALASVSLCIGAAASQTLYGSRRSALVRMVCLLCVVPAAVAINPYSFGRYIVWSSPAVMSLLPATLLFTGVMRALKEALDGQERSAAREGLLARTSHELIAQTDAESVRAIRSRTAAALCELTPGLVLIVASRAAHGCVVTAMQPGPIGAAGPVLPRELLASVDSADTASLVRLQGETDVLDELTGRRCQWLAMGLGTPDATAAGESVLIIGMPGQVPVEVGNALRTLSAQLELAELNCRAHEELTRQAHHDDLTSMPNRAVFFRRLITAMGHRHGVDAGVHVLIIDLDDFKQINDSLGHAAGDELLIEIATRITDVVGDVGIAARFGGDEFAVVLPEISDTEKADQMGQRLRERLIEPVRLVQGTVMIGASIGLAAAAPGLSAADLLRCADIAMYGAKARGKNRVERFSEAQHGRIAQVRLMEDHLQNAVERREITLDYQPLIDLKTGCCLGFEALTRWHHPTLGQVDPVVFVPIADQSGYASTLGAHVLNEACAQLAAWSRLEGGHSLRLAVKVSIRQLAPEFEQVVRQALSASGLSAHRLTLELSEAVLLEGEDAFTYLGQIADLGVRIALDDFGARYASLAYLQAGPVHQLKIDRRLLRRRNEDRADAMVQMILSASQFLGLETVAQGVETPEHADWARRAGIGFAQGVLFSPPLPADAVAGWLSSTRHAAGAP